MTSIYTTHASWFHLLTAPADYDTEAAWVRRAFADRGVGDGSRLLELGSGGGNMASHLRPHFAMTLTDLSPDMLALSETINPGAPHLAGDMRALRLGESFDAVLIHDAICYMLTEADLAAALTTAFTHLRPGGVAIFQPDDVAETFEPTTDSGGHAGADGRALRYLEWTHSRDPNGTVRVDFAILLRHPDGAVELLHDPHVFGLFPRAVWRDTLAAVGFAGIEVVVDDWDREVFIGRRPL